MSSATMTTKEFADLLGVSDWAVYESVRRGDSPIEPIRVGRRLVWSRARIEALLGLVPECEEDGPTSTTIDDRHQTLIDG